MSAQSIKKQAADQTRIGEYAAMQPLSGIKSVNESGSVNGAGHVGFVRPEETERDVKQPTR